ncbi:MAG: RagB/SusD family nutrient uptake outer membrane protein [Niabella sp.]
MMKTLQLILILLVVSGAFTGCKKFLALDPLSNLSGNNFWRSKEDADAFTNGNYELLRKSVTRNDLTASAGVDEFPFFIFGGDFRGAPVVRNTAWARYYIDYLTPNDIKRLMLPSTYTGANWYSIWNLKRFTEWDRFFKVISSANIAVKSIKDMADADISDADRKRFIAENVFLRCFVYFLMVRQWGDVPYYTTAFQSEALGRTPALEVLQKCAADIEAVRNDLPWTYDNPVFVAVRAMRGSALDLLMQLNMWSAFFDTNNAQQYYRNAAQFGQELLANNGAYVLLPLTRTSEIFKGRSREGLFEIPQNKNYSESFGWSTYYDHTKRPDNSGNYPYIWYTKKYMEKLYPPAITDARKTYWYDETTMYNENSSFLILKFLIDESENNPNTKLFDASQTVFRYSEALLLYAEALSELGQEGDAKEVLNLVRQRAGAPNIVTIGDELKDDIFWERQRETMGEGHYWYDMVRTRRVLSNEYGFKASAEDFYAGSWTWPISRDAKINNPKMTLNNFWE